MGASVSCTPPSKLLETESLDWEEVELAYDHGEVRCWHAAAMLGGELLVHSGLTQEYYLTRQVSF